MSGEYESKDRQHPESGDSYLGVNPGMYWGGVSLDTLQYPSIETSIIPREEDIEGTEFSITVKNPGTTFVRGIIDPAENKDPFTRRQKSTILLNTEKRKVFTYEVELFPDGLDKDTMEIVKRSMDSMPLSARRDFVAEVRDLIPSCIFKSGEGLSLMLKDYRIALIDLNNRCILTSGVVFFDSHEMDEDFSDGILSPKNDLFKNDIACLVGSIPVRLPVSTKRFGRRIYTMRNTEIEFVAGMEAYKPMKEIDSELCEQFRQGETDFANIKKLFSPFLYADFEDDLL